MKKIDFSSELTFKTSRSSGAGGQNVNKVETSVTALWNVQDSLFFDDHHKTLIQNKLKNRINNDGILYLTSSEARTQLKNKKIVIEKILEIVNECLVVDLPRIKTKPTKAQVQKRLTTKKKIAEKKESRRFKY